MARICVVALLLSILFACSEAPDTHLTLRQQIDQLKANVPSKPTNLDNIEARLPVVWAWVNEMALESGGLKFAPNLPATIRTISAELSNVDYVKPFIEPVLEAQGKDYPVVNLHAQFGLLDNYIKELSFREDYPDAIGALTTPSQGPFVAHSFQTLQ
ncbi:MAG: hypothetical protein GKR90_25840 [Pseudomonadales bacterium]|nr:hypothetical protein [Pseudomonadales bacterium]